MDGFTLQDIAFPVAPANLDGFTLDGFAWVDLEPVVTTVTGRRFTATGRGSGARTGTGRGSSGFSATGDDGRG